MAFTAGQKVRAVELNQGVPALARAGSSTSVVSSTALVNATGLVLPVEADALYRWDALLFFTTGTGGDIKFAMVGPTGSTGRWGVAGPAAVANTAYGTGLSQFVDGANTMVVLGGYLDTDTTAGSLQVAFAQNTSDGTTTTVRFESVLSLSRLL